jgi:UDP-N-acetyl-D-glucosamine dehydrogenase
VLPILLRESGLTIDDIEIAYSPERIDPANKKWGIRNTPKLVAGLTENSTKRALEFYGKFIDSITICSSVEIAETAKLLENSFRFINISFVNELAMFCEKIKIDVNEVISTAATKPYGYMPFRPGVGVGGHCIPVDPLYLTWWARKGGQVASLVERSDEIANQMPIYVAERALALVESSTATPKVLIMGVAYKPGVGDVRETPASALRAALVARGAEVACVDPLVPLWEGTKPVNEAWDCDVAIVATKS